MTKAPTPLEKVQKIQAMYPNLTVEAMSEVLWDDCITHEAATLPYGGEWRGPQGFLDLMDAIAAAWKNFKVDQRVVLTNDKDLVAFRAQISGDGPAGHFDMPVLELWTFRDGKASEVMVCYFDTGVLIPGVKPKSK